MKRKELSTKELLEFVAVEQYKSALKEAAALGAEKAMNFINDPANHNLSPIDRNYEYVRI
jgi:hypothetical protein